MNRLVFLGLLENGVGGLRGVFDSIQKPAQYQQSAQVSQQSQGAYSVSLSCQAIELTSDGDTQAQETEEAPVQQVSK